MDKEERTEDGRNLRRVRTVKLIAGMVSFAVSAPYLTAVFNKPGEKPPQSPKVVLMALQSVAVSTSISPTPDMVALDTMLGREISVAPRIDQHPRPAFISPSKVTST